MEKIWFRRAVVYHVLIDRFAGCSSAEWEKPVFCGGTLSGIIDKLPFLVDLGVDALYLSPFYAGTDYHGYHITDFYSVDPRFGGEADFKELIRRAHEAGLRVLIDFVPNHVSDRHPFFVAAQSDPQSRYREWFFFSRRWGKYRTFLDVAALPKLNLDHPEARDHVIGAALHWLACGADGLRIDHAVGPSRRFLAALRRSVGERHPAAVLLAEAWFAHPTFRSLRSVNIPYKYARRLVRGLTQERIQRDCVSLFDGALDFAARDLFLQYIARPKDGAHEGALTAALERHYRRYPASFFLPAFLDNHDTNRFYFECGHDRTRLLSALEFLFRLPQPVIIYYGTETGLSQEKAISPGTPHADLQARRTMNWDTPDLELTDAVRRLIRKRRARGNGF